MLSPAEAPLSQKKKKKKTARRRNKSKSNAFVIFKFAFFRRFVSHMRKGELVLQEKLGHDGPHGHNHRAGAKSVKHFARDCQPEIAPSHRQGKQNVPCFVSFRFVCFYSADETMYTYKTSSSSSRNRNGNRSRLTNQHQSA